VVNEVNSDGGAEISNDYCVLDNIIGCGGRDDSVGAYFVRLVQPEGNWERDVFADDVDSLAQVLFDELRYGFCPGGLDGAYNNNAVASLFL
jgi:hypothetical protein